jgi:hypothetical protein
VPDIDALRLTLVRAPEDEASFSPQYQAELRRFYSLVRAERIRVSAASFSINDVAGSGGLVGEFVVPLGQAIGPVLGRAAIAWLQGRGGRMLHLKIGDLEFEVTTQPEFEALLALGQAMKAGQPIPELDHE